MRIALVNPKFEKATGPNIAPFSVPPLSLMKCGYILEQQNHDVEIRDFQVMDDDMYQWAMTAEHDVFIVSTSPITSWQCPAYRHQQCD